MAGRQQRTKKNGKLFQRPHGDCFLHVTAGWLSYWPASHANENLMVVRVSLSSGHHFLTTLSPQPLPSNPASRRNTARYLEIDTEFAKQLGIKTYGIEVLVEAVGDIERCTRLCLEPLAPEDLDKLESNQEKIEYELLNRIRVVSGQSFSFPIWIDQEVIPVRVVSSEPAATWVLLGSELTGIRGEAATTIVFKRPTDLSPSSSSSDSYHSPLTPRTSATNSYYNSVSAWGHGGVSSEETSPDTEPDVVSIASSTGSRLFEFLRPLLSAINSQGSIQAGGGGGGGDSDRPGTRTPEPATLSPPNTVVSGENKRSWHRKTRSCSQLSNSVPQNTRLPKYIETPDMDALLRVQPHSIRGPGKFPRGSENSDPFWEYSRVFDVYVHPATFPEISNYYHSSQNLGSFLVQIKSANVPSNGKQNLPPLSQGNQSRIKGDQPLPSSTTSPLSSVTESESVSSPVSETGFELSRIMSVVASSFQDSQSDGSDGASSVKPEKPVNLVLPDSLVVRLCFATKLVSCAKGRVLPLPHPLPPSLPEELGKSEAILEVAPGHIVLSDIVRRQLQIGACSLIRVCGVKEEGRLPSGYRTITVHLSPMNEQSSIMKMHRELVEERLREWVRDVSRDSPFGATLVNNQIVPLLDSNGDCDYCSVGLATTHRPASGGSSKTPLPLLLHYAVITPQELLPRNYTGRVRIVAEKTQWSSGGVVTPPPLSELDPPTLSLNPGHYGAFEELLERGREYLDSVLVHCGSGNGAGRLLVTGSTGDAGLACGKTSLARLIVQSFASHPTLAHVQLIDCTSFRAQTAVRVGRRLCEIFETAVRCQPSVVLLDDLHNAMPAFSDGEEQTSGEATLATRLAQALLDQLSLLDRTQARVVVMATARCRDSLHPMLLQSRGRHVFEKVLEIAPPDLVSGGV
jgi:hypothetical protein